MMLTAVFLHFGGAGTYTVAFMVSVVFLLIFVLSFALGSVPGGSRRFSRKWIAGWLKASLPRLAVAGAFSAAFFIASSLSGNTTDSSVSDASVCDRSLSPLTAGAVTEARLQAAIAGMRRLSDAASNGDENGAQAIFFGGDTHNVTHDIDSPLRSADLELAKQLCRSVVVLELQFTGQRDLAVIAKEAGTSGDLLERAGPALGLSQ